MNYELIIKPKADADIERLPLDLRIVAGEKLMELAEDPVRLSRPTAFPYPPGCQIYHFRHDLGLETWHFFTILFRYGQDETSLHILGVGHVEYDRDIPEEFEPPMPRG